MTSIVSGSQLGFSSPQAMVGSADTLRQLLYLADGAGRVLKVEIPTPSPADTWNRMKASLAAGNTYEALKLFEDATREKYRELFCFGADSLPSIANQFPTITPLYIRGTVAAYRLERQEEIDGVQAVVPYDIYFDKDENDEWRIRSF